MHSGLKQGISVEEKESSLAQGNHFQGEEAEASQAINPPSAKTGNHHGHLQVISNKGVNLGFFYPTWK